MKPVKAGIIKDIINDLKSLSEKLFNFLSAADVKDAEFKFVKSKETKENEYDTECKYKDKIPFKAHIKITSDDTADIRISVDVSGHKEKTIRNVKQKDVNTVINDTVEELLDEDDLKSFGIKSSRKLRCTLQRVTSSRGDSIRMTAIKAYCDIPVAQAALNEILVSDDFMNSIPKVPTTYEVCDLGDEFDVVESEPLDTTALVLDSLFQILCAAVDYEMQVQTLHWKAYTNQHIFAVTGDMMWGARNYVDNIGMWIIQTSGKVMSPYGSIHPETWLEGCELGVSQDLTPISAEAVSEVITKFIDTLDFFYPNLPHDLQFEVDRIIRELKEQRDFRLMQTM